MARRIIFGALLIALTAGLLWLDWRLEQIDQPSIRPTWLRPGTMRSVIQGLPLAALVGVLVVLAYGELRKLTAAVDLPMPGAVGLVCCVLVALQPFWWVLARAVWPILGMLPLLPLVMIALFVDQLLRKRTEGITRRLAGGLLAVAYLGICGSMLLSIRMSFGVKAFVLFVGAVKGMDMGAYFCGKFFGRHKLISWLSPNKTWEGLLGGAVVATTVAVVFALLFDPVYDVVYRVYYEDSLMRVGGSFSLLAAGVAGLIIGLAGQGADLCESALKRDAKVKDTAALVPEFGGVLDIIDSPLLAAPIAYVVFAVIRYFSGIPHPLS